MVRSCALWLIVGLLVVVFVFVPLSNGINCYDCIHSELTQDVGLNTTCADPFVTTGVKTCGGADCLIIWLDFGSQGYVVNRTCLEEAPPYTIDQCLMIGQIMKQYKFFLYKGMCCIESAQSMSYNGTTYNFKAFACMCTTDSCNGAMQNYITRVPSTISGTTGTGTVIPVTTIKPSVATKKPTTKKVVKNSFRATQPLLLLLVYGLVVAFGFLTIFI